MYEDQEEDEEGMEFDPENMDEEQLAAYYAMHGMDMGEGDEYDDEEQEHDHEHDGE